MQSLFADSPFIHCTSSHTNSQSLHTVAFDPMIFRLDFREWRQKPPPSLGGSAIKIRSAKGYTPTGRPPLHQLHPVGAPPHRTGWARNARQAWGARWGRGAEAGGRAAARESARSRRERFAANQTQPPPRRAECEHSGRGTAVVVLVQLPTVLAGSPPFPRGGPVASHPVLG